MPARSLWKSYLKLSLVSIPVRAYTGSSGGGGRPISLNQLHEECGSRIRYKKTCPVHGEVPGEEIVSGYEYTKGQYVVIDPAELDKLRTETDKSVSIDSFVPADAVDPAYLTGRTYYLLPDGPVGQKPYQLVCGAMAAENLHAIATAVLSNREQIVRLRVNEGVLAMDVLEYKSQVKEVSGFRDELVKTDVTAQEKKLTKQLIDSLAQDDFDPEKYSDLYTERLTQLIEAKVEGKELVTPPPEEEPHVINLMEALKRSVRQAKPGKKTAAAKPPKKKAASATTRSGRKKAGSRKKKSG